MLVSQFDLLQIHAPLVPRSLRFVNILLQSSRCLPMLRLITSPGNLPPL